MPVIIGSARHDENGKIKGGAAGDNTGKEVCTEKFYAPASGWRVFRAKDTVVAERLAWNMQAACSNDHIGYDQSNNQSLLNVCRPLGYDCEKVKTNCETDCSQLVRVCLLYAGIDIGMFSTADEPAYLIATGKFTEMTGSGYSVTGEKLKRGDLLVTRKKGHTCIVISNSEKGIYMFAVDTVKNGSKGASVTLCQKLLKVNGYKGKDKRVLACDGIAGANTVYAINSFQTAMRKKGIECGTNGKNDGICGAACWAALLGV